MQILLYFPREIKIHKNMYMNVHSVIIHTSQKVEKTQMSIKFLVDKQSMGDLVKLPDVIEKQCYVMPSVR